MATRIRECLVFTSPPSLTDHICNSSFATQNLSWELDDLASCGQATAPGLQEKLGPLAASHAVAGKLHSYFVERWVKHLDKAMVIISAVGMA